MVKLQINKIKTFIQFVAIKIQMNKIKTLYYMSDCLQFMKCFSYWQYTEHCCVVGGCIYS